MSLRSILALQSPVVIMCTTRFDARKFYVLPTQFVYVFYMELRKKQRLFPYTALTD